MQLKSRAATEESKGQTLQKPKKRTAAKNTEALKAVYKRLYAGKVSEDAAGNGEAAQSKQVAMEKAWHLRVKCATSKRGSSYEAQEKKLLKSISRWAMVFSGGTFCAYLADCDAAEGVQWCGPSLQAFPSSGRSSGHGSAVPASNR